MIILITPTLVSDDIYTKLTQLDEKGVHTVVTIMNVEYNRCQSEGEGNVKGYNGIGYMPKAAFDEERIMQLVRKVKANEWQQENSTSTTKAKLLDDINRRCNHLGLPSISAMVVNKETGLPGDGFRQLCINAFGYDPKMTLKEIVDAELIKIEQCDSWGKLADSLGIEIPYDDSKLPEEMDEEKDELIVEGAKRTITVNSYERDPRAKKKCKEYYLKRDGRITCQVCGFDFGKVYGPEYDNMIHVHHIVPVSDIGEEYVVDPVKDLLPVCPNCHMVLHAGAEITVEKLRERLKK